MRKEKYYLVVNEQETRVILRALIRLKNKLIQQGRYTDIIDELIMKIARKWK